MPYRTLLAREQRRMRGEYEIRLRELERERIHAEQDKAQVTSCSKLHAALQRRSGVAMLPQQKPTRHHKGLNKIAEVTHASQCLDVNTYLGQFLPGCIVRCSSKKD